MTTSAQDRPAPLDLSLEESWVVHTALLDALERAYTEDEEPTPATDLLVRVEAGDEDFTRAELDYIVETLCDYRDEAPDRDVQYVARALAHIEAAKA
ncbi:hypothetical protein ACFQJC_15300 [Haloferax namakaokahaiae]|uniref:Uncharacterized protein n=1 Tax=Haloferax namakaokahaiae TaxID=1748331 RepID=A0ABD5ZIM3_9EURY